MPYKSFLVADLKTGLALNREPWLIPKDAFTELVNGYLYEGVLTKRRGYKEFGRLEDDDPQDYTDVLWVETDVAANRVVKTSAIRLDVTNLDGDEDVRIMWDHGAAFWNGDYKFQLDINCTASTAGAFCAVWAISQDNFAIDTLYDTGRDFDCVYWYGGTHLRLFSTTGTRAWPAHDESVALTTGTDYWLTIWRRETAIAGEAAGIYCRIYSDVNRSVIVDTLYQSFDVVGTQDHRYVFAMGGYDEVTVAGEAWTGIIRNLSFMSYPDLPVVGLLNYQTLLGVTYLLAANTKRLFRWSVACQAFEDITFADIWGGAEKNFVWACNWNDVIYMTNGLNQIVQYNGTTVSLFPIDLTAPPGGANEVDTCKMIFVYKERLVLLHTTETTPKPQRARWCKIGNPADWCTGGDEFVDAPTDEHIVTAGFIGDDLIVLFERSVWKLRYTADSALPFVWEQISPMRGSAATFSIGKYSNHLTALDKTSLVITDGLDIKTLSDKLPGFALTTAVNYYHYGFNIDIVALQQAWLSYVGLDSTTSTRVLCRDYKEQSWSIFLMNFLCFGAFIEAADPTWDEMDIDWDDAERIWDECSAQAGFPTILGGKTTGYVYQMNYGTTDDSVGIDFTAKSGRWNPFEEQGMKARMGWIDFLVDVDPSATITVNFYKDTGVLPYKTATFVCTGTGTKTWQRVPNGEVGDFHMIEITHAGNQQIRIHAIAPFFKPAGRMF